jgi:hypothetical protein
MPNHGTILAPPGSKNQKPLPLQIVCTLLDRVGMATYALPVPGEFADILWAPLSGLRAPLKTPDTSLLRFYNSLIYNQ